MLRYMRMSICDDVFEALTSECARCGHVIDAPSSDASFPACPSRMVRLWLAQPSGLRSAISMLGAFASISCFGILLPMYILYTLRSVGLPVFAALALSPLLIVYPILGVYGYGYIQELDVNGP